MAQSMEERDFPADVLILIQSELDYLDCADREIRIELDEATPAEALRRIGSAAGLTIEVDGTLPEVPKLSKSFENASVKEVLTWYASRVPVLYKTKSVRKLVVLVRDRAPSEGEEGGNR
jgi:hypothetical protein